MTFASTWPSGLHDSQPLLALLDNAVLWWGLAACGFAQLSKLGVELVVHRRWRLSVLAETGGMPSSHSALMTGTAAALGWERGFDDPLFALASSLAFIVLYDSSGVRFMAGRIASRVNALPSDLWRAQSGELAIQLKENLGHTRLEVLVGSLLGPAVALPGLVLVGSPLHLLRSFGLLLG